MDAAIEHLSPSPTPYSRYNSSTTITQQREINHTDTTPRTDFECEREECEEIWRVLSDQ